MTLETDRRSQMRDMIITKSEQVGSKPIRAHHISRIAVFLKNGGIFDQWKNSDDASKLDTDLRISLSHTFKFWQASTSEKDLHGEDNHTYREDMFGYSLDSRKETFAMLDDAFSKYYSSKPEDSVIINSMYDYLCDACAIGEHCFTGGSEELESRAILTTVDWIRISRVVDLNDFPTSGDFYNPRFTSAIEAMQEINRSSTVEAIDFGRTENKIRRISIALKTSLGTAIDLFLTGFLDIDSNYVDAYRSRVCPQSFKYVWEPIFKAKNINFEPVVLGHEPKVPLSIGFYLNPEYFDKFLASEVKPVAVAH